MTFQAGGLIRPKIADPRTQKEFYYRVKERVLHRCGAESKRACLYWTYYTMQELRVLGITGACVQAGNLSWLRVSREDYDQGEPKSHFSYQWSPTEPDSRIAVGMGNLPEIHIWVGLPASQEIIDLATGFLPQACETSTPMKWTGEKPPDFFWGSPKALPELVQYEPIPEACVFAIGLLNAMARGGHFERGDHRIPTALIRHALNVAATYRRSLGEPHKES